MLRAKDSHTQRTKCSFREPILAYTEQQECQISGKFNTGLCQKLNTLTLVDIGIENPLAPLARLKDTPLVQTQEPIEKQAQNFDPPNGQRGYINSKQHNLLTELSMATDEIHRESKLQSCLRNNTKHLSEGIAEASYRLPWQLLTVLALNICWMRANAQNNGDTCQL